MIAFHGKSETKDFYAARVLGHQQADEIAKGFYWEDGRGCGVGCTVHSGNHGAYETEMGIPRMLARLEDRIFEGMPNSDAKLFPAKFIAAIPVGADLSLVGWKFLHWLVSDVVARHGTDHVIAATVDAIEILRRKANGEEVSSVDAHNAAAKARKAVADAATAAATAAYAVATVAGTDADATATAADGVAYVAAAAAAAAAVARATTADAAYVAAARQKSYALQAEKLLELLAQSPVMVPA